MDIEKLIEQYQKASEYWRKNRPNFPDVAASYEAAATALSTFQAENERLKNKLSELAHLPFDEPGIGERTRLMAENALLRAELEQVKRERDAAMESILHECKTCVYHTVSFNGCTPDHDCSNPDGGCSNNYDRWVWCGQKED